jgi:hypothetical protein
MQRALATIGIALLVFGLIAPGLEAALGCADACPDDEEQGHCADGMCCSCCMYASPAALMAFRPDSPTLLPSPSEQPLDGAARRGEGEGLLHVPKAIRS